MADFRKWILVLAVLAAFVIPASAQQVVCTVASSNQPVRAEGIAETVGQITLVCASTLTAPTTANFTAFFTANVTSQTSGGFSAAVLTTPDGLTHQLGVPSGNNSLVFNGVPVPQAGGNFTISNVRINASTVGAGGSVTVIMSASSPNNNVVFTGIPTAQVATVQSGLSFAVASGSGAVNPGPLSFPQCSAPAIKLIDVTFKEGFAAAFKSLSDENATVLPPGTATQATRIFASFSGVPANVNIAVPAFLPTTAATIADASAILVGFNATAGGTGVPVTAVPSSISPVGSTSSLAGAFGATGPATFQVPLSSGSGVAVYELTGIGITPQSVDTITLTAAVQITPGVAVTGTTGLPTVSGGFAPISTVVTAVPATGTGSAPVPRFVNVATQNDTLFSVVPCVTNLLFPFVTNQAGFDTGIALVNTSADNDGSDAPFSTTPQHGSCTVFFFNGTTTAPAPQTTGDIPAGGQVAFTLQSGGVAGSTSSAAGFQGYIIAQCNFQFAHGFAFISDMAESHLGSQGYLALVIPDRGGPRVAQNFTTGGTGEQLAQ